MELLKENDPKLHAEATAWDFETDGDPTELVKDMVRILTENGGVGLAAPQVGISKSIFIMGNFTKMVVCINPQIVSFPDDDPIVEIEGCLSFPELWLKVKRPASCTVQYQSTSGEVIERQLTGIEARVFLHELDHLLGITFDERASDMNVKLAKEKRTKYLKKMNRKG